MTRAFNCIPLFVFSNYFKTVRGKSIVLLFITAVKVLDVDSEIDFICSCVGIQMVIDILLIRKCKFTFKTGLIGSAKLSCYLKLQKLLT